MANEAKTYAIFRDMLRSKGYYDDKDVVLTPTLPIIGEGAHLFLSIVCDYFLHYRANF